MDPASKEILIVDDIEDIRELVQEIIDGSPWKFKPHLNFTQSVDGLEAYELLLTKKFDLVITDLKMPFLPGEKLIEACRAKGTKNKNTPFVVLSGYLNHDTFKNDSLTFYLRKPITEQELSTIVGALLCGGARLQELVR